MSVNIVKHLVAVEELSTVINLLSQTVQRLDGVYSKLFDVATKGNQLAIQSDVRTLISEIEDIKQVVSKDSTLSQVISKLLDIQSTLGEISKESTLSSIYDRLSTLEQILSKLDELGKEQTLQNVLSALTLLEDIKGVLQSIQTSLSVLSVLSRLDVDLSTRASEETLTSILNTVISTLTTAGNVKTAIVESSIKVPTDIQDHWTESVTLLSSGARTSSGTGSDVDVARFIVADVCVDVTAVSGTSPTLSVYVEGRQRAIGKYRTLLSFENINATGTYCGLINPLAYSQIRVRWVVGGTSPSFTFAVVGEFKS